MQLHLHHIIPKYMGGTDEPDNLIELTIEDHAIAHRHLWKMYGNWQDEVAYKGLLGLMNTEECYKKAILEGSRKGGKKRMSNMKEEEKRDFFSDMAKKNWEKNGKKLKKMLSENAQKSKKKKLETGRGIGGMPPNKYCWITNGEKNDKILIENDIPEGWYKGRTKYWRTGVSKNKKEVVQCPHCGKTGGKPSMSRFHFDNCKRTK